MESFTGFLFLPALILKVEKTIDRKAKIQTLQ